MQLRKELSSQRALTAHTRVFNPGPPLDFCLRLAWEAVLSFVVAEHCAGAGPSLLWHRRKGELLKNFLHIFKLVLCFSHSCVDGHCCCPSQGWLQEQTE